MEEKIMHLLITEDDMALAQGLQRALQEKNRQVLCCKNIQETRQHLHQNQTDLLILDVNLPDGSGFDLLQEIRRTSDLPVILLTANDLEMDIVSGLGRCRKKAHKTHRSGRAVSGSLILQICVLP